jgi:endo-1,4-beta-xylanase
MGRTARGEESLRELASETQRFVGTIIDDHVLKKPLYRSIIANEFNAGVAIVFMNRTQPQPGKYDSREVDNAMQFAREHGIRLAGHALVYRLTSPDWLNFGWGRCGGWEPASLDHVLKQHIQTVVAYGGELFYVWDVVNEPFTNDGELIRSCWYRILGPDYIAKAFRYAHEANPNVLLRLNETFGRDGVNQKKADSFFAFIQTLKEQQVPIHVAGIQMHLEAQKLRDTYAEEFRYFLQKAQNVGVQVHVTEMDVYQGPEWFSVRPFEKQKEIFKTIIQVCLEFPHCTSVATWGLTDNYSWLRTRKILEKYPDAKPLLFDDNAGKKPAYFGVAEAFRDYLATRP